MYLSLSLYYPVMASNLLQGVLRHSAHEHLDALVHDKDDSDDELVNVVRSSIFYFLDRSIFKMPSFHCLEHPHALAHRRAHHHPLGGRPFVSLVDPHLQHPQGNLPIPSGYFPPRYLRGYLLYSESMILLDAHVFLGNGARVRP
jgi:hypothetical protein